MGFTTNPRRRLRQHNGELRGGARRTRGGGWDMVVLVHGFPNVTAALRFEWSLQNPHLCRGLKPWLQIQYRGRRTEKLGPTAATAATSTATGATAAAAAASPPHTTASLTAAAAVSSAGDANVVVDSQVSAKTKVKHGTKPRAGKAGRSASGPAKAPIVADGRLQLPTTKVAQDSLNNKLKVLAHLLHMPPFCNMALTLHWLRQDAQDIFEKYNCAPPAHVFSSSGSLQDPAFKQLQKLLFRDEERAKGNEAELSSSQAAPATQERTTSSELESSNARGSLLSQPGHRLAEDWIFIDDDFSDEENDDGNVRTEPAMRKGGAKDDGMGVEDSDEEAVLWYDPENEASNALPGQGDDAGDEDDRDDEDDGDGEEGDEDEDDDDEDEDHDKGATSARMNPQNQAGVMESQQCRLCKQYVTASAAAAGQAAPGLMACWRQSCRFRAHSHCLAQHFLGGAAHLWLVPVAGSCPECNAALRWGDLVRRLTLQRHGVAA